MAINRTEAQTAWWALRLGFFIAPFLAGIDKFFHLLTNWDQYLAPWIAGILPFSGHTFMLIVGVIEMIAGLAVLTRYTRLAAYVISLWLLAIVVNLVTMGRFFDIALRDIGLAIGAFSLAKLTEARVVSGVDTGDVALPRAA